ncbi:MAG TPA: magnesium-translocating P-type ATPase, partial [Ignavibacteria bacterium]|nr:magnesium-translocating P-type ATPase [Ignavibacteria bacterium]
MVRSIFSKISPSIFTKEAKSPHQTSKSEQLLIDICSYDVQKALQQLNTDLKKGLTSAEAEERLDKYGYNGLAHSKTFSIWIDLFNRLKSPLVIQLLIIVFVSAFIGEVTSTLIVGSMVLLSVGLSYVLDRRSSKAVESLGKRVQSHEVLIRDGKEVEVPMSDVVPGDIVLLHAGSIIPADLRLISTKDFFVSQSILTGESMPIEKKADEVKLKSGFVFELENACFQGSNVLSGSARGVVVNTGIKTYFGTISEKLAEKRVETSFDKGVKSFMWLMIRFMVVMVFAVFMIVGITKGDWIEALLFGLSIAVGLTPEMLPMIVTVNLAKGALTMSKKKVIVKQLSSIQNFGAIDILCTDKT